MSAICPEGLAIVALDDDDLDGLGQPNKGKILLKRSIDIGLRCNFVFDSEISPSERLEIVEWQNGHSALCGSCAFCNLIKDGLDRELNSELRQRDWKIPEALAGLQYGRTLSMAISLKKLEYHKDPTPWAMGQKSATSWDLHLALFRGHATLSFDGTPGPGSWTIDIEPAFELFGEEGDPAVIGFNIHRRPLPDSPLCKDNIQKIQGWMQDCDENHTKCSRDTDQPYFLPTRLLDVGDDTGSQQPKLMLSAKAFGPQSSESNSPKYMALSYCWPSPDHNSWLLTTTRKNISERLNGIETDTMPQTFRDAVTVARALKIQYIWIDSLCIVQDDNQDWQVESGKMAEIFSNAHLTVVTAVGDSCHNSFLQRDLPRPTCSVPFQSAMFGVEGNFSLRYRHNRGVDKMAEIREGRWISRGWTFQEERLARQVLMFGKTKFFFGCRTVERSEDTTMCRQRPDWVDTVSEIPGVEGETPLGIGNGGDYLYQRRTPYDHWQTLCSHYSRRDLSYSEDKLPAISGMANKVAKRVQSDYLAGLWRGHLMHDLFWHTVGVATKSEKYRAPSWSWASLDGHVAWPTWRFCVTRECELYCEISDAKTEVEGLDSLGAVSGGFLRVSGFLLEVEVSPSTETPKLQFPWCISANGQLVASGNLDIEPEDEDPSHETENKTYWALLMAKCKGKLAKQAEPRGLLLQRAEREGDTDRNEFERVGIFKISHDLIPNATLPLGPWEKLEMQSITVV